MTVTLSVIAGDDVVNHAEATAGVVVAGTTANVADGEVGLVALRSTTGTVLAHHVVTVQNNAFSYALSSGAIPDGHYTVTADVRTADGAVEEASRSITVDLTAPTLTFQGGISPTHASFGGNVTDANATSVQVFDHGTLLGTATTSADGAWTLDVDLSSGSHYGFSATATDAAGNSSSAVYSPPPGQPTPAVTTGITGQPFSSETDYTDVNGHVTTGVYQKADGSLYQQVSYGYDADGHVAFTNTTNADGTTTSLVPVSGNPNFASTFTVQDDSGHVTNQVYTRADGSTYQSVLSYADGTSVSQRFDTGNTLLSTQIDRPDGTHEVTNAQVSGQSYVSSTVLYDSGYHAQVSQYDYADGHHLIVAGQAGQHLFATSDPDVLVGAGQDTFVFHAGFGSDQIGNFDVNSDVVQLTGVTDASGLQAALANAHDDASGSAVLTFSAHDTLTFAGIHTAQLQQHAGDFLLA